MMLRSSSTPILGSLLSSFSESPNRDFENNKNPLLSSEHLKKISFSHGGNLNFTSFSCYSSPLNRSISGFSDSDREIGLNGFRRAQSDGNLEGLAAAAGAGGACDIEEFHKLKSSRRNSGSMLQTIPSFSIFNSSGGYEDEEDLEEEEEDGIELNQGDGFLERSVTIGDSIMAQVSGEFSFGKKMDLIEEEEGFSDKLCYLGVQVEEDGCRPSSPPMFLARGLGIDVGGLGIDVGGFGGGGGGFGNDFNGLNFGEGGEDESKTGEYYKKMVEEHPCSALFLRNYAQFLYKTKHDLWGADEYYSRAILADPQDGEILSQYAKLVWELHHDHERASSYFERAVQAAPEDSHVHAAYASFLWETEDIEEEVNQSHNYIGMTTIHSGIMASATA